MTSELKCPVCNHKLYQTASEPATYCCLYKDCQSDFKFAGSKELWQALIQAKQDLVIAKSTLEYLGYEFPSAYPEKNVIAEMRQKARNAVKYIEHKESLK